MISLEDIIKNTRFETSRSQGPGGQHVNKTETKVTAIFHIGQSLFSDEQKVLLRQALATKVSKLDEIAVSSSTHRSQYANKDAALWKLHSLLSKALHPRKKRIRTKPSLASKETRLSTKKKNSDIKKLRRRFDL
jgi:ribosome-associated protein